MSYDLHFWRQNESVVEEPLIVRDKLIEGIDIAFIETLNLNSAHDIFKRNFPELEIKDEPWMWDGNESYFEVYLVFCGIENLKMLTVNCGFKLLDSPDTMNLIIDSAHELGCALYDPQTNERYEQPNL